MHSVSRILVQTVWFISIVLVVWLSTMPGASISPDVFGIDKVGHFAAYAWLSSQKTIQRLYRGVSDVHSGRSARIGPGADPGANSIGKRHARQQRGDSDGDISRPEGQAVPCEEPRAPIADPESPFSGAPCNGEKSLIFICSRRKS